MTEWNQVNSFKDDRIQGAEYTENFDRFCSISGGLRTALDLSPQKFVDGLRPLLDPGKVSQTEGMIMCCLMRKQETRCLPWCSAAYLEASMLGLKQDS
jgi:hypothetical protein